MSTAAILGMVAAGCSVLSFAPQAIKIIRTRATRDISTGMYVLTVSAFALWSCYGLCLHQWPLVLSNGVCLLLSLFILIMKLLPASKKKEVARALTK